jgi:uncharacterized protein YndB with AHSA1/START domain
MTSEYEAIVRREIVTTRVFAAPRAAVFEAWTDPNQLKQWWGPARLLKYIPHLRNASRRPMDLHHARPQRNRL